MTEIEFNKLIEHEINWLSYYGLREDREKLNIDSDIYKDVRSIGYTKRVIPLMDRCSPGLITCNNVITKNSKFEDLISIHFPKGDNKFTPIETFFILFPDRKMEIIKRLIPEPISSKGIYYKN
jgi:hypothetical protein